MADITPDVTLDCKGLNCPIPLIKTKKALDSLEMGKILYVQATDPGTKADIPALVRRTGNEIMEMKEERGEYHYYIKKLV